MLGNPIFFFETRKNMVKVFGTLFNDIHIQRTNANNEVQQIIRVPLTYAPKNKLLLRADKDPDASKDVAIVLPRMAFEMVGMSYDGRRKQANLEKYISIHDNQPNRLKRQYTPVPYDLTFNLYIYVNHLDDGDKIIEQILPFFTPDWTVSVHMIPEMQVTKDIPIVLQSASLEDKFDGEFKDRRVLVWTLTFVMHTYFFGPVKSKPIIKFVKERFFIAGTNEVANSSNNSSHGMIEVKPGMDANGAATSNASLSVDANTIYATNTFGYVESFTSGPVVFDDE